MAKIFACSLLFVVATFPSLAADDPIIADLNKAKAVHAKELARLREKLITDIDAVIRKENDRGAGIDFLLRDKKGFLENGVLPLLPKFQPANREYQTGKQAADAELEKAYGVAIGAGTRDAKFDLVGALRKELTGLRGEAQKPEVAAKDDPAGKITRKDPITDNEVDRANATYSAAMKAASADLIEAFEEARNKVAASKTLNNDEKLKQLAILKSEKKGFEASATFPTAPVMRAGLQRFNEASRKAQQAFGKAMDAAAAAYLERKDEAKAQAVLGEKKRLLVHPNSIDLLALVDLSKDVIGGGWELKKGVLSVVSPAYNSIVQIPYEPGQEYNLHLMIERVDGNECFGIGLVVRGKHCNAMFDGWPGLGHRSGLNGIDGKQVIENDTNKAGTIFPTNKPVQLDLSVRSDYICVWSKDRTTKTNVCSSTTPVRRTESASKRTGASRTTRDCFCGLVPAGTPFHR